MYISNLNRFCVRHIDFSSWTQFDLTVSFEIIQIYLSPFRYKANKPHSDPARVFALVGHEDVLLVRIFWVDGDKYMKSVLHLSDIEFMWDQVIFIDPYKLLVRNENHEIIKVQLDPALLGMLDMLPE